MRRAITITAAALVLTVATAALAGGGESKTVSETVSSTSGTARVDAGCKNGLKAVAGGFKGQSSFEDGLVISKRSVRKPRRSWSVGEQAPFGKEHQQRLTVYGYCADEDLTTKVRTKPVPEATGFPPERTRVTARCPDGQMPISGGYSSALSSSTYASVSRRSGARKWAVIFNSFDPGAEGTAQANCYEGARLDTVAKQEVIPASDAYDRFVIKAKCPRGETALSGGFKSTVGVTEGGPMIFMSRRRGERTWAVGFLQGFYSDPTEFTTYAYCA